MVEKEKNTNAYDKSEFHMRLFLATTNVVQSILIAKEGETLLHHLLTHGVSEFEQTEMGMRNMHFFQSERNVK